MLSVYTGIQNISLLMKYKLKNVTSKGLLERLISKHMY